MERESLGNNTTNAPRKVKFAPKGPPRRVKKPVIPKIEKTEESESDAAQAQELLRRFNEASMKTKPKLEKKVAPVRVAFGHGGVSTSTKLYGATMSQGPSSKGIDAFASGLREEKEYKEPWDYYTYYPVTLPLRRPYSGNPELLDEEEFGKTSESMNYDEYSTNPAEELGLMEENLEASMFFLQLPSVMPMIKQSATMNGKETTNSSKPSKVSGPSNKACGLDELPGGLMGKMLVYQSGAIKLKLGDTVYNVSAGMDCAFAQDLAAINTEEKHCCVVGELNKHAVISPDVESILDSMPDL